ncbi:MAG: serine/threonine protein phosphatase PrpC [Polyangiales bacterium]|jgi:serine/threonine protein phosphatase PrpC
MKLIAASLSHIGRRANNEDAALVCPQHRLFVVADGMGGYEGGEVASAIVVNSVSRFFSLNADDTELTWPLGIDPMLSFVGNELRTAIVLAHRAVEAKAQGRLAQMGATVVAMVHEGRLGVIAHLGDSRAYRLRRGLLERLTVDHSYPEMLRAAGIEDVPPGCGHIVTRAVGKAHEGPPEMTTIEIEDGDRFLLCSDGVSDVLDDLELQALLCESGTPQEQCERIARNAYGAGGQDNITALVLHAIDEEWSATLAG